MKEIWKAIPDWEDYEVSNKCRVRSIRKNIIMQTKHTYLGYPYFQACRSIHKVRTRHTIRLHRIMMVLFVPNPDNKPHVAHLNGNPRDNRLENLIWATEKENNGHKIVHGTQPYGSCSNLSKLKEKDVVDILMRLKTGETMDSIAKLHNVCHQTIADIKHKRRWTHVELPPIPEGGVG